MALWPGACASRPPAAPSPEDGVFTVRIVNRNWADMRVYLGREGQRAFLGLVTSGAAVTFPAPADMARAATAIRLVAEPVGSADVFVSEPFLADPGRTVEWTIRVRPEQSSTLVH